MLFGSIVILILSIGDAFPDLQSEVLHRVKNVNSLVSGHIWPSPKSYRPYRYNEIKQLLYEAERLYPSLVKVSTAQEEFANNEIILDGDFFECGDGEKCKTHIVELGNRATPLVWEKLPEMFISGALHGDERLGPNTSLELILLLTQLYGHHPLVTYLLNTRRIILMPMTNSHGYAHNARAENSIDPNRDFSYDCTPESCMQTIAARAVNELFLRHLFQLSITFHGGTRVLSYEWGSYDHIDKNTTKGSGLWNAQMSYISTEAPDYASQIAMATKMQEAAGVLDRENHPFERMEDYGYRRRLNTQSIIKITPSAVRRLTTLDPFYPSGPMSNLVYPVRGGFEDWSYSGSWLASPSPITVCKPSTYGQYPEYRTMYNRTGAARSSTFLVEMDYFKNPPVWQWGHSFEVMSPGNLDGHVSRNLRLTLKLMEFLTPEILLGAPPKILNETALELTFLPVGCDRISQFDVIVSDSPCDRITLEDYSSVGENRDGTELDTIIPIDIGEGANCISLSLWADEWELKTEADKVSWAKSKHTGAIPITVIHKGFGCIFARARFDLHWAKQDKPDPALPPQTHIARIRLEDVYQIEAPNAQIDETALKVFPRSLGWGRRFKNGIDLKMFALQTAAGIDFDTAEPSITPEENSPVLQVSLPVVFNSGQREVWKVMLFESSNADLPLAGLSDTKLSWTGYDPFHMHDWADAPYYEVPKSDESSDESSYGDDESSYGNVSSSYGNVSSDDTSYGHNYEKTASTTPKPKRQLIDQSLDVLVFIGTVPFDAVEKHSPVVTIRVFQSGDIGEPQCALDVASLASGVTTCGNGVLARIALNKDDFAAEAMGFELDKLMSSVDTTTGTVRIILRSLGEGGLRAIDLVDRVITADLSEVVELPKLGKHLREKPYWVAMNAMTRVNNVSESENTNNLICHFTPVGVFIRNNKTFDSFWYRSKKQINSLVNKMISVSLGYLKITPNGFGSLRVCNVWGGQEPITGDFIRVTSLNNSNCSIDFETPRSNGGLFNPLASRLFTSESISIKDGCAIGSVLTLSVQSGATGESTTVAECSVHRLSGTGDYINDICHGTNARPTGEQRRLSLGQMVIVAAVPLSVLGLLRFRGSGV